MQVTIVRQLDELRIFLNVVQQILIQVRGRLLSIAKREWIRSLESLTEKKIQSQIANVGRETTTRRTPEQFR